MNILKNFILFFLITSCGFKPLYHADNRLAINNLLNNMLIINKDTTQNIESYKQIIFKNIVVGVNDGAVNIAQSGASYNLEISNINEYQSVVNLDRNANASEYNYNISINAILRDNSGQELFNKSFVSEVNLSAENGYYASQILQRDYRVVLAQNIAAELKDELLALMLHYKNKV